MDGLSAHLTSAPRPTLGQAPVTAYPSFPGRPTAPPADPAAALAERVAHLCSDSRSGLSHLPPGLELPPDLYSRLAARRGLVRGAEVELRQLAQKKHPTQLQRAQQADISEQRLLAPFQQAVQQAEEQREQEKAQAERDYSAALARNSAGWGEEKAAHAKSEGELATLKGKVAGHLGKAERETLDELLRIEGIIDRGVSEQTRPSYDSLVARLRGQLDGRVAPEQLSALLNKSRETQRAGDFPRNAWEASSWVKVRGRERDASIARANARVDTARMTLEGERRKLAAGAARQSEAADGSVAAQLRERSADARRVELSSLPAEVLKSQAAVANLGEGRLTVDGAEFLAADGKSVAIRVRAQESGQIVVERESAGQLCRSTLEKGEDGKYSERYLECEYETSGSHGEVRGAQKRRLDRHLDANGRETYRGELTRNWDGGRREEVTSNTSRGQSKSGTTYNARGEVDSGLYEATDSKGTTTFSSQSREKGKLRRYTHVSNEREKTSTTTETLESRDGSLESRSEATDATARTVTETVRIGSGKTTVKTTRVARNSPRVSVESTTVDGKLTASRLTERLVRPETDVPGLGWIGSSNPQDLVEQLGSEYRIKGEKIIETTYDAKGRPTAVQIEKMSGDRDGNGEVDTELLHTKGRNGGSMWELRKRGEGGAWDTQMFFQGSRDTIVTRNTRDGEFQVTETTSSMADLAKAQKKDGKLMASHSSSKVSTADKASVASVNQLLSQHQMSRVVESDAFRGFLKDNNDKPLKVVATEASSTTEGRESKMGTLTLEAQNGRRLTAVYDPEHNCYTIQNATKAGDDARVSMIRGKERLELDPGQGAVKYDGDKKTVLEQAAMLADKYGDGRVSAGQSVPALTGWKARMVPDAVRSYCEKIDKSKVTLPLGAALGSAYTVMNGLSLSADLANGEWDAAARKAGAMGVDAANFAKLYRAPGWLPASVSGEAAGVARAGSWIGQGARFVGGAGLLLQGAVGVADIAQGEYARGAFGLTGAGGSALALFGPWSWAGPAGLGIGIGAMAATMAWDYDSSVYTARAQI